MPELPEVETICLALKKTIIGRTIVSAKNHRKNLRIDFPKDFDKLLNDKYISEIKRKAKYILIYLDEMILIIHLGMSGRLTYHSSCKSIIDKHDHAIITLDNGSQLVFNDPRRFGLITLSTLSEMNSHHLFKNLGIEPFSKEFNYSNFGDRLIRKNIPIKIALMDNKIIVGVGNIYASESLFRAKISPLRLASSLSKIEVMNLLTAIRETLSDAIKAGGSSLKDYVDLAGDSGYFQNNFNVYNKQNHICRLCNRPIQKIKQQGRTTFFCNFCQK